MVIKLYLYYWLSSLSVTVLACYRHTGVSWNKSKRPEMKLTQYVGKGALEDEDGFPQEGRQSGTGKGELSSKTWSMVTCRDIRGQ